MLNPQSCRDFCIVNYNCTQYICNLFLISLPLAQAMSNPKAAAVLRPSLDPFPFPMITRQSEFAKVLKEPRWKYSTRIAFPGIRASAHTMRSAFTSLPLLEHLNLEHVVGRDADWSAMTDRKNVPFPWALKSLHASHIFHHSNAKQDVRRFLDALSHINRLHRLRRLSIKIYSWDFTEAERAPLIKPFLQVPALHLSPFPFFLL